MDWEARPRLQSEPMSFRILPLQQLSICELLDPNIPARSSNTQLLKLELK